MDNDENKLKKRFAELSLRAVEQRRTVSSDFLTLDEQSTLASAQLFSRVYLYGGGPLSPRRGGEHKGAAIHLPSVVRLFSAKRARRKKQPNAILCG